MVLKRAVISALLGCCIGLLFIPNLAFSQDMDIPDEECKTCPPKDSDIDEPLDLGDVFVHAFHGGAIKFTPTSTIVDVDEYVKSGSVERVEDILMHMAGIDIMRGSNIPDPQQVIMFRGFEDSRYTVALDGRPVTGSSGKAMTPIDWSSLTLEDIEKIEIIRGGASAKYENSEGGVINIITKKGVMGDSLKPRITLQTDYTITPDYTSADAMSGNATISGGAGDLGYFLSYGKKHSDGFLRMNEWNSESYSARFTYEFQSRGLITFSYKGSDFTRENPVVNEPTRADYDPRYPTVIAGADTLKMVAVSVPPDPGQRNYKDKSADHYDLAFEQPIKESLLKLHIYRTQGEENNWYVAENSSGVKTQQFRGGDGYIEKHIGGGAEWNTSLFENNSLDVGYSYKRTGAEEMPKIFEIHAGYFEDLWAFDPKWTLKTGLRVSRIDQRTYPYVLSTDPPGTPKYRHYSRDLFWLPKFTLTYKLRPETSVYVSINRDYHVPGC